MEEKNVEEYCKSLDRLGIENKVCNHPSSKKAAEVLSYLNLTIVDCVPTLIMKADNGFIAVVIRGDCRADFKTIIDNKVLEKRYLMGGSGSFSCSIQYKTDDLIKIPQSIIADIAQ